MSARIWIRGLGLALVAAAYLAAPTGAQERDRAFRSDGAYEELIHQLELGMSALEQLGRIEALERLQRITDEVREERKFALRNPDVNEREKDEENGEIREVRRRLGVMRHAVEVFSMSGDLESAEAVELAMHSRELAIEGRREAAAQLRERAPNRGELAELLTHAGRLHQEMEHPDRAHMLLKLAEVYAKQWQRRQAAQGEGHEREQEGSTLADSLERRVQILRLGRDAVAEAGRQEQSAMIERAIRYGELVLEGAGEEDLAAAAEGVPRLGNLAELLQVASQLYREWGDMERAQVTADLSKHYAGRARDEREERAQAEGGGAEESRPEREGDRVPAEALVERSVRVGVLHWAQAAHAEAGRESSANQLAQMVRVGELQLEGGSDAEVAQAAEGLSMGMVIEHLQAASTLYREWRFEGRAAACNDLAEFYARRGREREQASRQQRESDGSGASDDVELSKLLRRVEELQKQLDEIQELLQKRGLRR